MVLKRYLTLMVVGTLLCWAAWAVVLLKIDPFVSGFIGLGGFYLTLFLGSLGTFSLLGFLFRKTFSRDTVAFHHITISLRQGLFFSFIIALVLFLRGMGLYTWWMMLFLVAGFTVLEFFFLARES